MLSLQPGQRISQYELIEKIGQGGMGVIWKALDTELKRRVAIKFLPTALSPESDRRVRFRREAQTAAALDHPNIAVIHEIGELEGHPFIVMQLLEGKSLRSIMQGQPLPFPEWVRFAIPMADALAYAHRHGIVHRDLKPDNVMMTSEGHPKIVDFGLAKLFDPQAFGSQERGRSETLEQDLTRVGQVFGTFAYMSPEQARGDRLDHRSDIFSLGVIIYEMAGGRRPFEAGNPAGTLAAIVASPHQPLSALVPDVHPVAEQIVRKALEKDPEHRYQHADELSTDLKTLKRDLESGQISGATQAAALQGAGSRRPLWLLGLLALLSVVIAAAVARWEPKVTVTTNMGPQQQPARSIAVIGFENLSDRADPRNLGRVLMGLVTTDLTESGGLTVASTAKVLAARRDLAAGGEGFDSASASEVARGVGAGLMLVGQVAETERGLILTAELVDVASGESLTSIKHESPDREGYFEMAGEVADSVRRHLSVGRPDGEPFDLAKALTSSTAAYRSYLDGERAFQGHQWGEAAASFGKAVEIDPTFALACYRAGMTLSFYGDDKGAMDILEKGLAHVDRMPARWQTIYTALLTWHKGDTHDAFVPLQNLVATSPHIPDAYYLLGEIRTHSSRHFDPAAARELFQRARDMDPAYTVVNDHLIDAYLAAGDIEAATRLVESARADDNFSRESELKLLAAESRFGEMRALADEMMEELRGVEGEIWTWIIDGHIHVGEWDLALEMADLAVREKKGRQLPSAHIKRGQALAGKGRLKAALASFREAQALTDPLVPRIREFGTQGHHYAASLLAASGLPGEAMAEARQAVEKDPFAPEWLYFIGRLHLAAGRTVEAAGQLGRIRALASEGLSPPVRFWESVLEAEIRLASSDLSAAKAEMRRIFALPKEHRDKAVELKLRSAIARANQDFEGATREMAAFLALPDHLLTAAVTEKTVALFALAGDDEALGRPGAARAHYGEVIRRWGGADIPVPMAGGARARLAALPAAAPVP
jgi:tetratricopeptide (TPR) repeat protein